MFAQFEQSIGVEFHIQNAVLRRVGVLSEQNEILAANADDGLDHVSIQSESANDLNSFLT